MEYISLSKVVIIGSTIGLKNLEELVEKQVPGVNILAGIAGLDIKREYEKIEQRKSTLSTNKRKLITLVMEREEKEER